MNRCNNMIKIFKELPHDLTYASPKGAALIGYIASVFAK